jgi:hypothetical protein
MAIREHPGPVVVPEPGPDPVPEPESEPDERGGPR